MRSKKIQKVSKKQTADKDKQPAKKRGRKAAAKKVLLPEENDTSTEQTASIEDFNSSVDTSFFYTNDKRLNAIDDGDVIKRLSAKYPDFNQAAKDSQLKKTFLLILEDEELIEDILEYFDINILDFFKIVYKSYSALFNTLFINKVRDKIKNYRYAKI